MGQVSTVCDSGDTYSYRQRNLQQCNSDVGCQCYLIVHSTLQGNIKLDAYSTHLLKVIFLPFLWVHLILYCSPLARVLPTDARIVPFMDCLVLPLVMAVTQNGLWLFSSCH